MSVEKVKNYFKAFGIDGRIQEFDVSSATVELASKALNCEPCRIAKTLSFMVDNNPILIVTAGDMKIDNGKYKAQFGTKAKMLKADEVYIDLEQVSPVTVLMETTINGHTYPQAYLSTTPWGGRIAAFIPGHKPECTENPDLIADVTELIQWLKSK